MDVHTLKLVAIAAAIALIFGIWLLLFLNAERPIHFFLSLVAYPAMLGVISRTYSTVSLFADSTVKDVAIVTVLTIMLCVLGYALVRIIAAAGNSGRSLR